MFLLIWSFKVILGSRWQPRYLIVFFQGMESLPMRMWALGPGFCSNCYEIFSVNLWKLNITIIDICASTLYFITLLQLIRTIALSHIMISKFQIIWKCRRNGECSWFPEWWRIPGLLPNADIVEEKWAIGWVPWPSTRPCNAKTSQTTWRSRQRRGNWSRMHLCWPHWVSSQK